MATFKSAWINVAAATVGGLGLGIGLGRLYNGFNLSGIFWAVLGFLLIGWAVLDRRRFRPGPGEGKAVE